MVEFATVGENMDLIVDVARYVYLNCDKGMTGASMGMCLCV